MAHIPVLLHECMAALALRPGATVADGTLGAGGHTREMLARITPQGVLLAVDRDPRAAIAASRTLAHDASVRLIVEAASYARIPELMTQYSIPLLDGLLLDLGFSSEQVAGGELAGRGFSFMVDEPLLMTYDDETPSVARILGELTESSLASIIREYGEERYADRIARSIMRRVSAHGIGTTGELTGAIVAAVPTSYERGRLHPATRTFQALRIYANNELGELERLLAALPMIMAPSGRVAIISFHSLEDRIVKQHFQSYVRASSVDGRSGGRSVVTGETPNTSTASIGHLRKAQLITKKPLIASQIEMRQNPRSRSAKLRVLHFV